MHVCTVDIYITYVNTHIYNIHYIYDCGIVKKGFYFINKPDCHICSVLNA